MVKIRPQVGRILRDLKSDDDDIATYAAMSILRLKEINEKEIEVLLPALRQATSNPTISVRFFSKKALNEVKLQMARFPTFMEEYEKVREETKRASWHDLLDNLEAEETEAKLIVLDYLRDLDDPLLPAALMRFIEHETDPFVIAEAIKVLGMIGDQEAIDFLERYLSHEDSRIRSNSVEAMAELGGKQVMRSILPLLEDDDNRVKATVAKICSKYGEHQVVATLEKMLHSIEIWMRESATYALGFVPCGEAVDLLLEAVCDVNPEIQRKAVQSLGLLRAKRAREFLNSIIGTVDPAIAAAAKAALDQINRDPREYAYFSLEREESRHGPCLTAMKTQHPAKTGAAAGRAGSLAEQASRLAATDQDELEESISALVAERARLCEELGQRALELYREGEFNRPYIQEFSNEVKKLLYLIEQKENQKKNIQEETGKSTFLSFIRESVSRFTQEKQVDSRMESLRNQLRETYRRLGNRLIDDREKLDNMRFMDIPDKIHRLDRQLNGLQKRLADSASG